ncbi:MAG: UbiH/UbiF/VisC/COQ6 family ubiquinone biosynthesis hydroxylase [Janthinobacterium lividum]
MSNQINTCDIAIIGGGLVGSVLAGLLAPTKLRIIVLDRHVFESTHTEHFDRRTTAVSWGSSLILQKMGLWQDLEPMSTPIREIRISQASGSGFVHFNAEDAGHHPMGFIVDNFKLRQRLHQVLLSYDNIDLKSPCQVDSLIFHDHEATIRLKEGEEIKAKLVIGADGRLSQIRQEINIKDYARSYHQSALVTSVRHELPHHNVAFEHFLSTGPLAFLPLRTHESSLVWSLNDDWADVMKSLSTEEFAQELYLRFPYLGGLEITSERACYPLNITVAHGLVTKRCVLIGDAAHAIHPIAGQGANLGFRDAEELAHILAEAAHLGMDVGCEMLLKRYQRRRITDIASLSLMTDGLVRLFSGSSKAFGFVRGQGLKVTQSLPFIRRRLTRHAMGL